MKKALCIAALALLLAACGKLPESAKEQIGPDSEEARKALFSAVGSHNAVQVKKLLESGVDVNARDSCGQTPLQKALGPRIWTPEDVAVIKLLIAMGSNPDVTDERGRSPLHIAVEHESPEIVALLAEHGADPNARDNEGWTPVHAMALSRRPGTLAALAAAGADLNALDNNGASPVDAAYREELVHIAQLLIERGGRPQKTQVGNIAQAALFGDIAAVNRFLESGQDVNTRDECCRTALLYAAEAGKNEIVNLLLSRGARLTLAYGRETPLHVAARRGRVAVVQALLKAGSDPDYYSSISTGRRDKVFGRTALHAAAEQGHLEVVNALIAAGAEVNPLQGHIYTPLDMAKDEETKALLRTYGAKTGEELKRGKDE